MQKIREDFVSGNSGIKYPSNINTEKTRAIYGIVYDEISKKYTNITEDELGDISLKIQKEIDDNVVRDLKTNEGAINSIMQGIDDLFFFYLSEKEIEIDFHMIGRIINEIMEFVLANY